MNRMRRVQFIVTSLAISAWFFPNLAWTSEPENPNYRLSRDVTLDSAGALRGQLINFQGRPVQHAALSIRHRGVVLDKTTTDAEGQFRLNVGKTGAFQMHIENTAIACRCWAPEVAPPGSSKDLVLLAPENTIRGQRPFADIISNPLFIGAVIATAIAIPIAVSSNSNGS
jgi:hypothetical protein